MDAESLGKVFAFIAGCFLAALVITNAFFDHMGEDSAPIWSCHTMGNYQCAKNAPWHGLYLKPADK